MDKDKQKYPSPALIVIGGFAGTGKTAVSRRLASELSIPRLGSDTLGRTIKNSIGIKNGEVDAYWTAYELLFLMRLNRSNIHFVDAGRAHNEVYGEVREYISTQLHIGLKLLHNQ